MTISRSYVSVAGLFFLATMILAFFFHCLDFAQIGVQPIEALLPELPVPLHPIGDVLERRCLEPAGPPLRLAAARDQPRGFQHLEMLGYRGEAHLERFGQLVY